MQLIMAMYMYYSRAAIIRGNMLHLCYKLCVIKVTCTLYMYILMTNVLLCYHPCLHLVSMVTITGSVWLPWRPSLQLNKCLLDNQRLWKERVSALEQKIDYTMQKKEQVNGRMGMRLISEPWRGCYNITVSPGDQATQHLVYMTDHGSKTFLPIIIHV